MLTSRRSLARLGLASTLAACSRTAMRVDPAQLLPYYERAELHLARELMPGDTQVEISGLSFVDWAYPYPERIAETQDNPQLWAEVTVRGKDGGPSYHGIKLGLGGSEATQDAKLIAFLPYAETRAVSLLKQAYIEHFALRATVSWIGVLGGEVWDRDQRAEADMIGLNLHGLRRL